MKSIDPGILPQSVCFTFRPSDFASQTLPYLTWCGHYFCTHRYYMKRETYPYDLLLYVERGKMHLAYGGREYTITDGGTT